MAPGCRCSWPFCLTCLVAVLVLGWVFKRGVVDPLFKYGMMPIVVATIGLSIAMRNGVRAGYSAEAHPFPSLFADKLFNIAGVTITLADVGTFCWRWPWCWHAGFPGQDRHRAVPCRPWHRTPRAPRCWASTCRA
jgi:hypothetical protein